MVKIPNAVSILRSETGGVFAHSLMVLAIASLSSLIIVQQGRVSEKLSRTPRIKSQMTLTEQKIRQALTNPSSYIGCSSTAGYSSCQLNKAIIENNFSKTFPGSDCLTPNCGIKVTLGAPDLSGGKYTVPYTIEYQGQEVSIKTVQQSVEVPTDVLQSSSYRCPDETPIFSGYDTAGKVKCTALPPPCGVGQYVAEINPSTLVPTCQPIQGPVACPGDQFIQTFEWRAGAMPNFTCSPRKNLFTFFGFTPGVNTSGSHE